MNTRFERILFDYDGTLVIHDAENEAMNLSKMLGIDMCQVPEFEARLKLYLDKYFTIKNRKMTYDTYLNNLNMVIDPKNFGITVRQLDTAIAKNCIETTVLANNVKETLDYLVDKGYELCLFTNGFYDVQAESMKRKGIFEYFERIYSWDDFYTKPDLRAFVRALANTNVETNVMIGDSLNSDIAPAQSLGIYTVGINMPNLGESLIKPDRVITDLSELKFIL